MAKLTNGNGQQQDPEKLIQNFAACSNFPREREGVLALAQALKRASDDFGIPMAEIVQQMTDISTYCPVPREIRSMAMSMRDDRRNRQLGSKHAEWERIYGPPQPEWSADLIGVLEGTPHKDRLKAIHVRAIRDMLFYTEGDGIGLGDRGFWEGDGSNFGARPYDLKHNAELVEKVRAAGGWRTERELQMDWIEI